MFCVSGLIGSVQSTLDNIERLNFTPFSIPYKIKKSSNGKFRFEACRKYSSNNWIWQFLLILIILGFTTYKLVNESRSIVEKAVSIYHIITFSLALIHIDEHRRKSETFVSFLNGLLRFETTYLKGKSAADESKFWIGLPAASFAKKSIVAFQTTLLSVPILLAICDTLLMKSPWFLLPKSLFEDWILPLGEFAARTIIFVLTYSFWRIYTNIYLILAALSGLPSSCGLSFVNLALERELSRLQTSEDVDRFIRKNREAKLLCSLYNEVHERRITPSLIVIVVSAVSVYFYALVSEWSRMSLVEMAICFDVSSAGILGIFCCIGMAANVFTTSQKVAHRPRYNSAVVQKILKKFWKSFQILKVHFGQHNYVDSATPLAVFDFAIDATVNLILVK